MLRKVLNVDSVLGPALVTVLYGILIHIVLSRIVFTIRILVTIRILIELCITIVFTSIKKDIFSLLEQNAPFT